MDGAEGLIQAFRAAGRFEADGPADNVLGPALIDAVSTAEAEWPTLGLDRARFVEHIAGVVIAREDVAHAIAALHLSDLYLATGCTRGVPGALAAFERAFLAPAASSLARFRRDAAFGDEVLQMVRVSVLVPREDRRPKIADYSGAGPLSSWLRVVVVRVAYDLLGRRSETAAFDDELALMEVAAPTPHANMTVQKYLPEMKSALQGAIASLAARDRAVLRYYLLERLNIDQIGVIYGKDRSTVARWIQRSRTTLFERARSAACERLGISESEFETLAGVVITQLDLSLERILPDAR